MAPGTCRALVLGAATIAASLGGWAFLSAGGGTDPEPSSDSGRRRAARSPESRRDADAEPEALSFAPEPGRLRAWSVHLESDGDADLAFLQASALGHAPPPRGGPRAAVASRLRAVLLVRFHPDGEGGWWVAARLSGAEHLVNGVPAPDADLLDRPFLCRVGPRGRVDGFRFPEGLPEGVAGACRSVLEEMETVLPESPAASWRAEEEDLQGTVLAEYRLLTGGEGGAFTVGKTRVRYTSPGASFPRVERPVLRVVRSRGTARRGSGTGWPDEVDREDEVLHLSGSREFGRSRTRFRARTVAPPADEAGPPASLEEALGALRDREVLRRGLLGTDPRLDALVADWDPAVAVARFAAGYGADYPAVRDLLLHYLRSDPSRPGAFLRHLEENDAALPQDVEVALWGMVARAGTPEAQGALAAVLLGERWSEHAKYRVVAHAADVPLPEPEYLDALWETHRRNAGAADDPGRTLHSAAAYAFGALGGPDRPDSEARETVRRVLAAAIAGAVDPREQEILLDAAGNAGNPGLLAAVGPMFASPDPAIRAAAFQSLRRMEGDAAAGELLRRWRAEPSPAVRGTAMRTLAEMPPSAVAIAFARAEVAGPLADAERIPLVHLLGATLDSRPEHEAPLRALLAAGPSAEVRKAIYAYVLPD